MCLVTVSHRSSKSKQSTTVDPSIVTSNPNPAAAPPPDTPATPVTPPVAPAPPDPSSAPATPPTAAPSPVTAQPPAVPPLPVLVAPDPATIAKFIAQLDAFESALNLDIVVRPNDKYQIRALKRVSDKALSLATDIVNAAPDSFTDFAELPAEAAYAMQMAPLSARVALLAAHVEKSVLNQRTPAANATLALYAVAKNLGRLVTNETMREKVLELKAEVAPKHKNPKPKLTKGQKAVKKAATSHAKKVSRALKVLTDAGVTASAPSPATPPTPAATPAAPAASNGIATTNGAPVPAAH